MNRLPAEIHNLFLTAGTTGDIIDQIVFDEETATWAVEFENETVVTVTWDDHFAGLVFEARLGSPHEQDKPHVYDTVLDYNAQWAQTSGARIARSDGELLLVVDTAAADLEAESLLFVLDRMREAAVAWSRFIADPKLVASEAMTLSSFV